MYQNQEERQKSRLASMLTYVRVGPKQDYVNFQVKGINEDELRYHLPRVAEQIVRSVSEARGIKVIIDQSQTGSSLSLTEEVPEARDDFLVNRVYSLVVDSQHPGEYMLLPKTATKKNGHVFQAFKEVEQTRRS